MNKKSPQRKPTLVKPSKQGSTQDERTRAHRAVNWVVSVILVAFAIWSIQLNAEGRSMLKQTTTIIESTETKIDHITSELAETKAACIAATLVVPVATTDTQ